MDPLYFEALHFYIVVFDGAVNLRCFFFALADEYS